MTMFGSAVLETMIGLFLIFLLLSLVASAINEGFAGIGSRRAYFLREGISRILDPKGEQQDADSEDHTSAILDHEMVASLSRRASKGPSYIPAEKFANVLNDRLTAKLRSSPATVRLAELNRRLLDSVEIDGTNGTRATPNGFTPTPGLKSVLGQFLRAAQDHEGEGNIDQRATRVLDRWTRSVADHFDDTMERVSGWYKRRTQVWLLGIGLVLTVAVDADSIEITKFLATTPQARESLVQIAERYIESSDAIGEEYANEARSILNDLGPRVIPLGWTGDEFTSLQETTDKSAESTSNPSEQSLSWYSLLMKPVGWLITAFAISLGAPFWFQTVSKLINLRNSGGKPGTSSHADESQVGSVSKLSTAQQGSSGTADGVLPAPHRPRAAGCQRATGNGSSATQLPIHCRCWQDQS
jgi:hypothetical protein